MKRSLMLYGLCSLFLISIHSTIYSQINREALLKEAREAHKKAIAAAANIFSEKEFKEGAEALTDAEEYSKEQSDAEKMIEKLNLSLGQFKIALENSKTLSADFASLLKARQLVLGVGVDVSQMKPWDEGEDNFLSAVDDFKDKDSEGVKKYSEEASKNYKDAEFMAIMEKYHGRLVRAIEKADDEDVEKYAPVTFGKINQYAREIEAVLNANRYDTLKARGILDNANYEIEHARYMQRVFSSMQKEDKTFEDLQLNWEEPLAKIGSVFSLPRTFDKGYEDFTSSVINNINSEKAKLAASQKDNENLNARLADLNKKYEEVIAISESGKKENLKLSADIDSLKKVNDALAQLRDELSVKLTNTEAEKSQYKTEVASQQKLKEQIAAISALFLPSEAEIVRNDNFIIIRLVNLNFPPNKATVDPQYYNLLGKVQKAIMTFPESSVVIEGHTDGQGDFNKNIETSRARANAVFQYLLSTMGADSKNITVAGIGGSKPIANNNTEEGRAKNRRIEIVISPNPEQLK